MTNFFLVKKKLIQKIITILKKTNMKNMKILKKKKKKKKIQYKNYIHL